MFKKYLPSFLFGISFFVAQLAVAQVDPLEVRSMDRFETKNFQIAVERSGEHPRPTAKEVGVLVEKLCSQLDKIFVKYSPYHQAKLEEEAKADADAAPQTAKKKKDAPKVEADPNRVIPVCKIFIFNDRAGLLAKCAFDGIEPLDEGYAGFFTGTTNAIYMIRSGSLQRTRETILHEVTHFYTFNFLPGGWNAYPIWLHEGLAMTYQNHTWNGDKLVVGLPPRLSTTDYPAQGLVGLVRLRTYTKEKGAGNAVPNEPDSTSKGKNAAKKSVTPIEPGLIQPFLDSQFTPDLLRRDGVVLRNPNEELSYQYAMYQALGRFLIVSRPDVLGAILRQIIQWDNEKVRNPPRNTWFIEAWKKVADEKPVSIEDIGTWVQKNQLTFKWITKDWQDLGDLIAGIAEEGKVSILLLRDPKILPQFTVFPKNLAKFQVGMVFNFVDGDNFDDVIVDENGHVILQNMRNGAWSSSKQIGNAAPVRGKNGPSFYFSAVQQGGVLRVLINKTPVGEFPRIQAAPCGFFISSTEAVFQP